MENKAQTSPFLNLPGEIRNRIYDFCQSETKNDFIILNLRDGYEKETNSDHKVKPIGKSHQGWRSDYFGLTQVNQLVRSEYLPLFYHSDKVYVESQDLCAYGKAFLGLGAPHPVRPSMVVLGCIGEPSCSIDVAPLLKLVAENTDVYFIYQDYGCPKKGWLWFQSRTFGRIVNILICTSQNPRYRKGWCVAADMISYMNIIGWSNHRLRIIIKREYYNSSLDDWGRTNSDFLERTGLDLGLVDFQIEYPD